MTTIGIIGSGHVGQNIAKAAIANGYDVVLSNNQGPGTEHDSGAVERFGQLRQAHSKGKCDRFTAPVRRSH
jgi:predicted dinucleotide-binding enzyme